MKAKPILTKVWSRMGVLLTFIFLLGATAFMPTTTIEIQVSPNVLNLVNQGQWVTVHTDIAYSTVTGASVTLNDVAIDWWKSDNQGNFVAKFVIGDIKGLFVGPDATLPLGETELTLTGTTNGGEEFSGTYTIKVINVSPSGK